MGRGRDMYLRENHKNQQIHVGKYFPVPWMVRVLEGSSTLDPFFENNFSPQGIWIPPTPHPWNNAVFFLLNCFGSWKWKTSAVLGNVGTFWCLTIRNLRRSMLVGSWTNPSEKYYPSWNCCPNRGEHKKCLKPTPRMVIRQTKIHEIPKQSYFSRWNLTQWSDHHWS